MWGFLPAFSLRPSRATRVGTMSRKRIGELLLDRGAITREQLEQALTAQKESRQRLGTTLVQMGAISEILLAEVLAQSLGLPTVDLSQLPVDWSAVHLLRTSFCERHELFPFAIDGKGTPNKQVMVAMSDPLDHAGLEEIEFTTGLKVAPFVSTLSQIRAAILRYYHKVADPQGPPTERASPASIRLTPPEDAPPMVVGTELGARRSEPRRTKTPQSSVTQDLDFLFGRADDEDATEKLEHKFWALMRVLAKKGLVTRDEFLKELEDDEG